MMQTISLPPLQVQLQRAKTNDAVQATICRAGREDVCWQCLVWIAGDDAVMVRDDRFVARAECGVGTASGSRLTAAIRDAMTRILDRWWYEHAALVRVVDALDAMDIRIGHADDVAQALATLDTLTDMSHSDDPRAARTAADALDAVVTSIGRTLDDVRASMQPVDDVVRLIRPWASDSGRIEAAIADALFQGEEDHR